MWRDERTKVVVAVLDLAEWPFAGFYRTINETARLFPENPLSVPLCPAHRSCIVGDTA
jgi:hypothetical protein